MKILNFIILYLATIGIASSQESFFESADQFFSRYVTGKGLVKYQDITNGSAGLQSLVGQIANSDLEKMDDAGHKAFLINVYNVLVIQNVIDHYPISSPMDVTGFFDRLKFNVGGVEMTLNELEKQILDKYKDERVHFALVCAAKGCPVLLQSAYKPDIIDKQLHEKTTRAMNDPGFIRLDKASGKVEVSEIFKWYKPEFLVKTETIVDYINTYRDEEIPSGYQLGYYTYNWSLNEPGKDDPGDQASKEQKTVSNIIAYTPSSLLRKGQIEVQVYNNLYTQTHFINDQGIKTPAGERQNYFTALTQVVYGISKSGRVNIGLDLNLRSVRLDPDPGSSPFKTLTFQDESFTRTTISTIGPKVKFTPLEQVSGLSVQSSFWIPVSKNMETNPWLDYDRYTWWNRIFYDRTFGNQFQLFTELDFLFRVPKDLDIKQTIAEMPVSLFLSYFPTSKLVFYGMSQYAPTVTSLPMFYFQSGLGMKYQLLPSLNIEFMYSNFLAAHNGGIGETFNLGLRYIR